MKIDALTVACWRKWGNRALVFPSFFSGFRIVAHEDAWVFIPDELGSDTGLVPDVVLGDVILELGCPLVDQGQQGAIGDQYFLRTFRPLEGDQCFPRGGIQSGNRCSDSHGEVYAIAL